MDETRARRAAVAVALAASTVLLTSGQSFAQKLGCGEDFYTVQAGDSLSEIAQQAYSSFNYGVIFDANRDVLENPAVLLVGQELFIPCLDGSGPATKAAALGQSVLPALEETARDEETAEPMVREVVVLQQGGADVQLAAVAPDDDFSDLPVPGRPVRFLTGSDFAPFTGRDLPEGGMLTDVVNRAMQRVDSGAGYEIAWENDWSLHLSTLLPEGKHDLGFPWYRPDCSVVDKLSPEMRMRCTDYDFSSPLYEVAVGYYMPADAVTAGDHAVLAGRTICRPAGYFTFDLEEVGLVEPNVGIVRPATPGECFEMVAAGEADVATMNTYLAEREIAGLGLEGKVVEVPELGSTETLHVLAPKTNPHGRAYLRLIDRGLRRLRDEGVWSDVTSRHLAEHAKSL